MRGCSVQYDQGTLKYVNTEVYLAVYSSEHNSIIGKEVGFLLFINGILRASVQCANK